MKRILPTILILIFSNLSFAQTNFSFNQGGVTQKTYYSTISYESISEKVIVKVTIKGKQYRFILDTGAPTTISSQLFGELNLSIITKVSVSDANAVKDSLDVVSLSELIIGDITFTNIPTLVAKQSIILACFQVDGLIGSNLLRNSVIQFNDADRKINITDDKRKLVLKSNQSSDLFLDNQSSPYIWVRLKNKKKGREQLLFDTGMDGLYDLSLNHFGIFQKYNLFEILGKANGGNTIGLHGVAKDTTHYRLRLPIMEINGARMKNLTTQTTSGNNSRIGSKVLEYGIVTLDYRNKKFYFDPFFRTEKDVSERLFPVDLAPCKNQLCIGFVWDTALAQKIAAGDLVTAIDGISYESINICDSFVKESIFKNKDKVTLTTKDGNGKKTETIIERK